MKAFWREHKRVCEKKELVSATDDLVEQLSSLHLRLERLWLFLPEPSQETIAQYVNVKSLCRTDSVMTSRTERKT